ncbi:hypothetical protein K402DRAFT_19653 [Aulographum hederae CBS 113979]|uniref:Uncharacterized protein n=1 Tax=Aulographum hederae CBS 113979 TaxID=1176131 RepID=A0A6G1H740_9PEZI|nr:hypothetical protein K402DRAFT_19653 [Aulographum hederae CBS 113979]
MGLWRSLQAWYMLGVVWCGRWLTGGPDVLFDNFLEDDVSASMQLRNLPQSSHCQCSRRRGMVSSTDHLRCLAEEDWDRRKKRILGMTNKVDLIFRLPCAVGTTWAGLAPGGQFTVGINTQVCSGGHEMVLLCIPSCYRRDSAPASSIQHPDGAWIYTIYSSCP